MNGVNKTLYIPLYGKSYVSKKGLFIDDSKAEEIWDSQGFELRGRSKSKWLAYYMGIRSAVFDEWVRKQLSDNEAAVVIHLGCGMDSRCERAGVSAHRWYDVDFAEVISERRRYYQESDGYRMIEGDVREKDWLESIPENDTAVVVMEGICMYLTQEQLRSLIKGICSHFKSVSLLIDCYTALSARLSKYKNPINDVGVTEVYGIDDPCVLNYDSFAFIKEHPITPGKFIDELKGAEKFIFRKLYAGNFAKKLYRLYEYKK